MKTCAGCRETKPESEFGAHSVRPDGLRSRCRECERKPPRDVVCGKCGTGWQVRQRGQEPKLCPACVSEGYLWCRGCVQPKLSDAFYPTDAPSRGHRCKECARAAARSAKGVRSRKAAAVKHRYGITLDEYEAHMLAPEGVCPCCGQADRKKMVLDHDHSTGRIRGVICSACNSGIGLLGDSLEGLRRAIEYLQKVESNG